MRVQISFLDQIDAGLETLALIESRVEISTKVPQSSASVHLKLAVILFSCSCHFMSDLDLETTAII